MNNLTADERHALDLIMCFIEDYDCCNMETYDLVVPHSQSINNEQYYHSERNNIHCFKSSLGNHPLNLVLKYGSREEMELYIYPQNADGTRIINFIYNFDDANGDEEWYEATNPWYADISIQLYETEEEYFQASTVDDLALTPEENKMFIDFNNAFTKHLINRIGPKQYGQSTP